MSKNKFLNRFKIMLISLALSITPSISFAGLIDQIIFSDNIGNSLEFTFITAFDDQLAHDFVDSDFTYVANFDFGASVGMESWSEGDATESDGDLFAYHTRGWFDYSIRDINVTLSTLVNGMDGHERWVDVEGDNSSSYSWTTISSRSAEPVTEVPEPGSAMLLLLGVAGLSASRKL